MNVVLVMFRENGERRSFSLSRDVTVVGRREDADFRIPLSDVSRKHTRLIKDGDTLLVEDLGSSNGTYHNGVRVQEAEVHPGDTLQIGPIQFVVQINGVPTEDELLGNTGATSTHLVNNNFPMGGAVPATALGGGQHEEELVDASDLEEIDDLAMLGDPAQLEEVSELEALSAANNEMTAPVPVASGDSISMDDFVIADESAEEPEPVSLPSLEPESLEPEPARVAPARPASPTRPAMPTIGTPAPHVAEAETPIDKPAEPLEAPPEDAPPAAIEPDADPDADFINMDDDPDTSDDDVLIDFGEPKAE